MRWTSWLKRSLLAYSFLLLIVGSFAQPTPFVRKFDMDLSGERLNAARQAMDFPFSAFAIIPEKVPAPSTLTVVINGQKLEITLDLHGPRPSYFLSVPYEIRELVIPYEGKIELYAINSGKAPDVEQRASQNHNECLTQPPMIVQEDWRSGLPAPNFNRLPNTVTHHIVHHAAGSNTNTNYTQVVRDIYLFHTEVNGWSDIGYNFLVAQDGTIYEGRDPGPNLTEFGVIGAHFCGKNTGTLGVSMLGNYETAQPPSAALASLRALLAFSFEQLGIDPEGLSTHRGDPLNHLSGHRDGCSTLCPGTNLFAQLPALRAAIKADIENCSPPEPPEPVTALSFDAPRTGNARTPVRYTNTSEGYETYQWFFAGGAPSTSSATTVEVTYQLVGTYDVDLIGFAEDGSSDTLRSKNYITVESNQGEPLVYPSPIMPGTSLFIELEDPIVSVEFFTMSGKEVGFFTGVDGVLPLPNFRKGIYILRISTQERVFYEKLNVQ